MPTLSFHAPIATDRKIRNAAKRHKLKVSRYLLNVAERAAENEPVSGLGCELEKLAIDGMALAALGRIRARSVAAGADNMSPAKITAAIRAVRRARA